MLRFALACFCLSLLTITAAFAGDAFTVTELPDTPEYGLPLGTLAPDFSVTDKDGNPISLHGDLLHQGTWTVLVTYRGGWCPFCNRHLAQLTEIVGDLEAADAQLVAVSVDLPDEATKTAVEEELDFLVLSDPSAAMFHAYNIAFHLPDDLYVKYRDEYGFDIEDYSGADHHYLTIPAVIILDPAGVIHYFHANPEYKERLTNDEVLGALQAAQEASLASPELLDDGAIM